MTDHNSTGPEAANLAVKDQPVESATPAIPRQRLQRQAKAAAVLGIVAVVAGGAAYRGLSQAQAPAPMLTSIVPQNAEMVLAGSPDYFWHLTESIRALPQVQQAITGVETKLKVTYDADVRPWAGQIAFYAHDVTAKDPDMAFYLQVKDAEAFGRFYEKIKPQLTDGKGGAPVTKQYGGITYYVISSDSGVLPKNPKATVKDAPAAVALLSGWVLFASNEATLRAVIDTYDGKAVSIQSSPKWAGVVRNITIDGEVAGALDIGAFTKIAASQAKAMGGPAMPGMPSSAMTGGMLGFSYSDKDSVLRTDTVFAPQSPQMVAMYKKIAAKMYPVTGASLQKVPDAALIGTVSNPGFLVRQELNFVTSAATTAHEKNEIARNVKKAGPYLDISDHFTGPASLAMTWNPDHGFGVVALAQADTPASALRAARVIVKSIGQSPLPIVKSGTTWSVPSAAAMSPIPSIPLTPVVTAQDRWLEISSHPFWIHPAGRTPQLTLPADASRSGMVAVGNFQWFPTVLDLIGKSMGPKDVDAKHGLDIARGLHLETATWSAWTTSDPSGAFARSSTEVRGFDLKGAIDSTVNQVSTWDMQNKITNPAKVTQVPTGEKA